MGDPSVFVGAIRGLLVQATHPEVVAGVMQQSTYRDDPLGRLTRTAAWVTGTTYGALPEVEAAVAAVNQAHRTISGTSSRGKTYSANNEQMKAWVHNTITESFLVGFQTFGPRELSITEADRFVAEQTQVGSLLKANPLPDTASAIEERILSCNAVAPCDDALEAANFLANPPLPFTTMLAYRPMFYAAVSTLPPKTVQLLGLKNSRIGAKIGHIAVAFLRWAIKSPDLMAAQDRVATPRTNLKPQSPGRIANSI